MADSKFSDWPYIHGYGTFEQSENSMFDDAQLQYLREGYAKADRELEFHKKQNAALLRGVAEMRRDLENANHHSSLVRGGPAARNLITLLGDFNSIFATIEAAIEAAIEGGDDES